MASVAKKTGADLVHSVVSRATSVGFNITITRDGEVY